ncbi:hypothetical protein AAG906_001596 [Vitis piasezkii]
MSCPYTPSQNGRAERKHRHVTETGLALLFHSHHNDLHYQPASDFGGLSPFEVLFGKSPNYENFHPFGCRVYPCLRDYAPHKFSPRSLQCIFLGYSSSHKGFRCFDTTTSRTYITRHARFDEHFFPFSNTSSATSIADIGLSNFFEPCALEPSPSTSSPTTTRVPPSPPCHFFHIFFIAVLPALASATTLVPFAAPMDPIHTTTSAAPASHPMITRAKSEFSSHGTPLISALCSLLH